MATLAPVSVTLPDDKVPTKKMVRDIIGTFLTKEWPSVDPETLTMSYRASFANAHCPVERPKPATGTAVETLKVFIKFHNETGADIEMFKHLAPSKQEEALLCYEYGRSGLGAKVYGFFKTQDGTLGRIDEFLDARNMEPEDVEDMIIRADVAKGLAMFHVLKTSLEKKPVSAIDIAAVAFRAITDPQSHNCDHRVLGPALLLSYDEVAEKLSAVLGRPIEHVKFSEAQRYEGLVSVGVSDYYAQFLTNLEIAASKGFETRMNAAVEKVTGRPPQTLELFAHENRGAWQSVNE